MRKGPDRRGAIERAQLRAEDVLSIEREANAAYAERGVRPHGDAHAERQLVAAEVERAKRDRMAGGGAQDLDGVRVLLFFARQRGSFEIQQLGAHEPDVIGAGVERSGGFRRRLDVGAERDGRAVERDRRRLPRRRHHANALHLGGASLLERAERRLVRAHHDLAEVRVHAQHVAGAHGLDEPMHAEDERQAERARHDGGVRRRTAALGGEADDAETVQLQRVDGREIEADDDGAGQRLVVGNGRQAEQAAQQAIGDLLDVGEALAEARVLHLREGDAELIDDHADGPLGADAAVADEPPRAVDELLALQDGAVGVDDLGACGRGDVAAHVGHGRVRRRDRAVEAADLGHSPFGLDVPLLDEDVSRWQTDRSNGDAAAGGGSAETKHDDLEAVDRSSVAAAVKSSLCGQSPREIVVLPCVS